MKAGTRIARWTVVGELAGTEELLRWELDEGAELVAPRAHVLLRPGARERFAAPAMDDPAVLPTLHEDVVDGVPVRVRPLVRPLGTITAEEADVLAAWLGPAAHADLRAEDVVVDADGVPRLAPAGVPRPESVGRPAPPEGALDALSGRYALATVLHAATGAAGRPAGVLARLCAMNPSERVLPPRPDPPRLSPGGPPGPTPRLPAVPHPRHVVVVALKGLPPVSLRRIAARSGADPAAVERAAARGAWWAMGGADTEEDATRLVKRLTTAGLAARATTTVAPKVIQYWIIAAIAAIFAIFSGFSFVFGVAAAVLAWMGLVNFRHMFPVAEARLAWQERERAPADPRSIAGRIAALRRRLEHPVDRARLEDAERELDEAILDGADDREARAMVEDLERGG